MIKWGVVVHGLDLRTLEVEAGGSGVQGQPWLCETLFHAAIRTGSIAWWKRVVWFVRGYGVDTGFSCTLEAFRLDEETLGTNLGPLTMLPLRTQEGRTGTGQRR